MEKNIQYINRAVEVLGEQIKPLSLRIVFDYETKFIDETENEFIVESMILSLLNEDDLVILEHEKIKDFENFSDFKNYINEFYNIIEAEIIERKNEFPINENELYSVIEYDLWGSRNSENIRGIFSSKFDAIISIQKFFEEIIVEESNNQFKPLSKEFSEESEFDIIKIQQITLNEIN